MVFDIEHLVTSMNAVKTNPDTPIYSEIPEQGVLRRMLDKATGVSERYVLLEEHSRSKENKPLGRTIGLIQVRQGLCPTNYLNNADFDEPLYTRGQQEYRQGTEIITTFNTVPGLQTDARTHLGLPVQIALFYTNGKLASRTDQVNGKCRDVSDTLPNEWFRFAE